MTISITTDRFTYEAPPTVTAVSPAAGLPTGGTSVTITGTNFTGASAVMFGSTAATSYTTVSSTSVSATSPAEAAGTVDVRVTTPIGTSAPSPADHFVYELAPTITAISPVSGPTAGGTPVTITGTGFSGATGASFGSSAATNYTVVSATSVTATSPAEPASTVNVSVTTPIGTNPSTSAD